MKDIKLIPFLLIILAALSRLLPHIPNFSPVAAIAIFGGAYLPKKYSILIPLLALLFSDYFIGFYGALMIFTYVGVSTAGMMGWYLRNKNNPIKLATVSLLSSLMFFIISNFGVWAATNWYPKTITGLISSFTMAIPFFKTSLIGDFFYCGIIFGGYAVVKTIIKYIVSNRVVLAKLV